MMYDRAFDSWTHIARARESGLILSEKCYQSHHTLLGIEWLSKREEKDMSWLKSHHFIVVAVSRIV